jgi:hypothetical protein
MGDVVDGGRPADSFSSIHLHFKKEQQHGEPFIPNRPLSETVSECDKRRQSPQSMRRCR